MPTGCFLKYTNKKVTYRARQINPDKTVSIRTKAVFIWFRLYWCHLKALITGFQGMYVDFLYYKIQIQPDQEEQV